MKQILLGLVLLTLAVSCGGDGLRQYHNSDLQLSPSYTAKEVCSCLFVMEMDEEFCGAWTRASPNVSSFRVDHEKKAVRATALLLWGSSAHFVSDEFGCVSD